MTPRNRRPLAPSFTRDEIIHQAEDLTKRFYRSFYEPGTDTKLIGINFDVVFETLIYPEYEIVLVENQDLGFDEAGEKIFGKFDVEENTAYIDVSLRPELKDPRRIFTCWHEVGGHGVLQGAWLREMLQTHRLREVVTTESMLTPQTVKVLERQANLFASRAAAPNWLLAIAILDVFNPRRAIQYIGPGDYMFNVYGQNRYWEVKSFDDLCQGIAYHIRHRFGGLSVEALGYRVAETSFVRGPQRKPFELHRTGRSQQPAFAAPFGHSAAMMSVG